MGFFFKEPGGEVGPWREAEKETGGYQEAFIILASVLVDESRGSLSRL